MNKMERDYMDGVKNFPGHGMQQVVGSGPEELMADEAFADAVQGALSEPIPTGAGKDRSIFERSIAARRLEKAKQQEIARAALAKAKQLTASIRSMEDALDGLLLSEA